MSINIEQHLQDISDYFKNKITAGDYEFISCGECTASVLIDSKYIIELWIANTPKESFHIHRSYLTGDESCNIVPNFKTQKERMAGWRQIKPYVKEYKDKVLFEQKKKEFQKLKREIEQYKD